MNTLAKRLRYAREQAGLSQSSLARQVGIKPQAIQFIEAGNVRRPRNLVEIAAVLGVAPEWLLLGKGRLEGLRVQETSGRYDSTGLSAEAIALARNWMELPQAQRLAVRETVQSLLKRRK
jgi:transcriptional regulator with XRE-family HTH domain